MKNKTKMFLLVSWLCLQVHVCVLGVEWTPPVTIPGAFGFPQVAVSADCGCAICVWDERLQIKSSSSTDGGQSWSSSPVPIPGASGFSPQVAVSADCGCAICVWRESGGQGQIKSSSSTDGGQSWSSSPVTIPGASGFSPQVAVSADCGCAICVWEDSGQIKSSSSTDGGMSWSTPVPIPGASGSPSLAVSADCGCAICVWQDSGQIKSSSSPDGGQSWSSSPVPIPGASGFSPQVAVSADCNCVVCVWNDEVNVFKSPIRSNFSVDGGVNWEGVETVTEDPSRAPGVAVSANCNCVICVWEDEDGTVKSSTLLISPTLSNLTACKKLHRFPRQADLIHVLSWDVVEDAVKYRVYIDTGLTTFTTTPPGVLIAEIPARKKPFVEIHSRCPGKKVTYYVAPVDENGDNGISASITV